MAAKKSYVVIKDFQTPQVFQTGYSHSPAKIGWRRFKKGALVKGELKTADGKPAFILVGKMTVVPIECVKEVVTKDVNTSNFVSDENASKESPDKVKEYMQKTAPKVQYMDAILIGALVGGIGWYFAEKKGWVDNLNPKNRLYAAGAGALLAGYFVYRYNNRSKKQLKITK
jgi:hypothetical protein